MTRFDVTLRLRNLWLSTLSTSVPLRGCRGVAFFLKFLMISLVLSMVRMRSLSSVDHYVVAFLVLTLDETQDCCKRTWRQWSCPGGTHSRVCVCGGVVKSFGLTKQPYCDPVLTVRTSLPTSPPVVCPESSYRWWSACLGHSASQSPSMDGLY